MIENKCQVSVIICSYNRARYIQWALESMDGQSLAKDRFEVIVVDNNSTDNTADVCRAFIHQHPTLDLTYATETNQGSSFARNHGASIAKGEMLVFMDDDAIAEHHFLERILAFFDQHPEAVGLGGRIIPRYIPEEPKWMSHFVSSLVGNFDYNKEATVFKDGKYPLESNMAVSSKAFASIQGFNTALPGVKGTVRIGGEGKDFFYRLMEKGGKIYYDPGVIVEHVVETEKLTREYMFRVASGIGRGERVRIAPEGNWGLIKKNGEYLFKLGASIVLGLIYLLQGHPQKAMPVIHFRIDALKGLNA